MNKTVKDMISGRFFDGGDPELTRLKAEAAAKKARVDAAPNLPCPERVEALQGLLAEGSGPGIILSPFTMQYGFTVRFEPWVFVNHGATFLDSGPIHIGTRTMIGPNVQFLTDTHPVCPEERIIDGDPDAFPPFKVAVIAHPITIGARCWVGGGATLVGPLSIGDGAMVAAGSVVTKDVPPRMLVAGNPARIIRSVDERPRP